MAYAIRTDDPEDACAGLLDTARQGCLSLRTLPGPEAWRRVAQVADVLGLEAAAPGDPGEAAGLTPTRGYRLPPPSGGPRLEEASPWETRPDGRLPLQEDVLRLVDELGAGDPASLDLLSELARVRVPADQGGTRFFVALARALDQLLWHSRYLAEEARVRELVGPVLERAVRGARDQGAQVYPGPGETLLTGRAPCPVRSLPAFGKRGRVSWVDRHGFVLPGGRVEEAVVRVGRRPAPPWFELLVEGYRALLRVRPGASAATYRSWLDDLPGLSDPERQATTVRYAATAVFGLDQAPGAQRLYERFLPVLERMGSFPIPLVESALQDEERYDIQLRVGAGAPRLIRPGFQGASGLVQQRARVVADPNRLGSGG